jgi:hypothetical protein
MDQKSGQPDDGDRQIYKELVDEVRKAAEELHETMIRFAKAPPTNPLDPIVAEWDAAHERAQQARDAVHEFWRSRRP